MEISKIQFIENKKGIHSSWGKGYQYFSIPVLNTISRDCFVKNAPAEQLNGNGAIVPYQPVFTSKIQYLDYAFDNKFTRTFFN